ncbi:MAG TPA: helix-turn-helix domain-containing protein [Deltaproteobacteria bacterium]|mgnify:CR=1 FL=1|nr:helix-turn-helix domain-containing protein [Deltaproteobacteria bacterium]
MPEKYVTTKEAAAYLGIEPKTLMKKARLKKVPCHRLPGSKRMRFRLSELDSAMKTTGAIKP